LLYGLLPIIMVARRRDNIYIEENSGTDLNPCVSFH
jgi:hypothetical protein